MRLTKPVDVERISQVLGKGACPICAYLKNDQAAFLRGELCPDQVTGVCNFHAWALAAAIDRQTVAHIFLNAINRLTSSDRCSVCDYLVQREVLHIKELIEQMNTRLMLDWLKRQGTFCRLHADHIRQLSPVKFHAVVDEIVQRSKEALKVELQNLLDRADEDKGTGGGVLGRAAEFLVSQRGTNH
jgi:hypothetical protein